MQQVKLAFIDDRKSKQLTDQREKQLREARATRASAGLQGDINTSRSMSPSPPPAKQMPGAGYLLTGNAEEEADEEDELPTGPSIPAPSQRMPGALRLLGSDGNSDIPPPYDHE
jgi:hypothetical protein